MDRIGDRRIVAGAIRTDKETYVARNLNFGSRVGNNYRKPLAAIVVELLEAADAWPLPPAAGTTA